MSLPLAEINKGLDKLNLVKGGIGRGTNGNAIVVEGISKNFRIPKEKKLTVFEHLAGLVGRGTSSYDEFMALQDVSFIARPGTVTAIVGRSGSGKSTLIKLIPRFYDAQQGQILLDGHPLQDYRLADLRRQIAMVGQQVMLFDGSIAQNVAYGELEQRSAEQLDQAIDGANAREFVAQMPMGLEEQVGVKAPGREKTITVLPANSSSVVTSTHLSA